MRLTPRGRYACVLMLSCWLVALVTGSAAASAAGATLAVAVGYGLATLPRPQIRAERRFERDRFVEDDLIRESVALGLARGRRAQVHVVETASEGLRSDDAQGFFVVLRAGEEVSRQIVWRAQTWGRKTLGPLRVSVRDAFGLVVAEHVVGAPLAVRVQPKPQDLGKFSPRAGNPEPALGVHNVTKPGDGFEFFALREYQPGDSIRRINWKASARSGSMIVNQVTRDSYARVLVLIDLREKEALGPHEESAAVRNGRAAASILAHHDRMHDHLNVLAVSSEARKVSIAPNPRLGELLDALADVAPGGDASLAAALRAHLAAIRPKSPVYFVTSACLEPDLDEALKLVLGLGGRPYLVSPGVPLEGIVDDELREAVARTRADALARARALGVVVVDWTPHQALGGAVAVA